MAEATQKVYTVVIEGNIGSGKTTFLERFLENEKVDVVPEPVESWRNCKGHNLLNLMYKEPSRYSFTFQSYVQLTMIQLHQRGTEKPLKMMERSLLSARYCFVENSLKNGHLVDSEYSVLTEWHNFLVTCPHLGFKVHEIIYLRTRPEVAFERVLKRNQLEEANISFKYLKDLHDLHEEWLYFKTKFQSLKIPVRVVEANEDIATLSFKYDAIRDDLLAKIV